MEESKQTMEKRYREIFRMSCTHPDSNNLMYKKTIEFITSELQSLLHDILEKKENMVMGYSSDSLLAVEVEDIIEIFKERGVGK